jgi:hypothetical protein
VAKSYVDGSAGEPVPHPTRRFRHGVAGNCIVLHNWPTTFEVRRCGPIIATGVDILHRYANDLVQFWQARMAHRWWAQLGSLAAD